MVSGGQHASFSPMTGVSALPMGSLVGFLDLFRSLAPRAEQSISARSALSGLPELRASCDRVLSAEDLADLEDRLDEMVLSFVDFFNELRDASPLEKGETRKLGLDQDSLAGILGITAAGEFQKGYAVTSAMWEGVQTAPLQSQGLGSAGNVPLGRAGNSPLDISALADLPYDSELPLAARELITAIIRGLLAAAVVARAGEHRQKVTPWLAMRLAQTFSDGLFKLVGGVMSMLPVLLEPGGLQRLEEFEGFKEHFAAAQRYDDYLTSFYRDEATHARCEEPV